jgi:FkbM family methyltransferase
MNLLRKIRAVLKGISTVPNLTETLSRIAEETNLIKNGMTVYTGDHLAVTKLFTGQMMYVDTRDLTDAPHYMLEGYWEMEVTTVIRRFMKPDTIFIDAGSNFGYFSIIAANHIKTGRIISIEPNPGLIPIIERSYTANGFSNIATAVNVAVSDKEGSAKLHTFSGIFGGSTLQEVGDNKVDKVIQVKVTTIDKLVGELKLPKVDLIKMDIEGYEEIAYTGMKETIARNPNLILFVEYSIGRYKDGRKFLSSLQKDFGNIYRIQPDSTLLKIKDYDQLHKICPEDWSMLIMSHKSLS